MSKSKVKVLSESFTNQYGQLINVGDAVCYKTKHEVKRGTFGGIYRGDIRIGYDPYTNYNRRDNSYHTRLSNVITGVRVNDVARSRYSWRDKKQLEYKSSAILRNANIWKEQN